MGDVISWIGITMGALGGMAVYAATAWCLCHSVRYWFDRKYQEEADDAVEKNGFGSHF